MPRRVRRVPPNWEHPRFTQQEVGRCVCRAQVGDYRPCYDIDYDTAARKWVENFERFEPNAICTYYWEEEQPPDPDTCRPAFTQPATWWQFYEETSEGTPITPAFATAEELARYIWQDPGRKFGNTTYQGNQRWYTPPSELSTFEELVTTIERGW